MPVERRDDSTIWHKLPDRNRRSDHPQQPVPLHEEVDENVVGVMRALAGERVHLVDVLQVPPGGRTTNLVDRLDQVENSAGDPIPLSSTSLPFPFLLPLRAAAAALARPLFM